MATGVMSLVNAGASRGSSEIFQKSRTESAKTQQSLEKQINQAKQDVEQTAKRNTEQAFRITISRAPSQTKPALADMSPALREYMRVQNS